jgi:hypothetical protein
MVAYTMTSLFLLAQPIVKESSSKSSTPAAVIGAPVASAVTAPIGVPPPEATSRR